jgi:hypothetical protein
MLVFIELDWDSGSVKAATQTALAWFRGDITGCRELDFDENTWRTNGLKKTKKNKRKQNVTLKRKEERKYKNGNKNRIMKKT